MTAAVRVPSALEPAGPAAMRYLRVCLEVLNGYRPADHLRRLTDPAEFGTAVAQLRLRRNARTRHAPHRYTAPPPAARRAGRATVASGGRGGHPWPATREAHGGNAVALAPAPPPPARNAGSRPVRFELAKLRVSEPLPDVAEVVALLTHGGATVAVAMRLERRAGAWTCMVIQVI